MECYYFGTFNPVHNGHLKAANDVISHFGFNKCVFVPVFCPCHKKIETNPRDRLNMLKLIENSSIEISDIEFKLPKPSYSYQTVNAILKQKPEGEKLNFIIGFDAFKNIEKWKNAEFLRKNIHFIVLKRTEEDKNKIEELKNKGYDFVMVDEIETVDVSSSQIRYNIQNGICVTKLLDEKVKRYIDANGLYRKNS